MSPISGVGGDSLRGEFVVPRREGILFRGYRAGVSAQAIHNGWWVPPEWRAWIWRLERLLPAVNGHEVLPSGGREISPHAVVSSAPHAVMSPRPRGARRFPQDRE